MSSITSSKDNKWFTPERKIDIAYHLAGVESQIHNLKKCYDKRLKEISYMKPVEIADKILQEGLNRLVYKDKYISNGKKKIRKWGVE